MRPAPRVCREAKGNGLGARNKTAEADGPAAEAAREVGRLRSVAAAQKWDIDGLTEQRDALLRAVAEQDATIAALETRFAEQESERIAAGKDVAQLRERASRSAGVLRIATDLIGLLLPLMSACSERESAGVLGRLLATVGLIDAEYYRGHGVLDAEDGDAAAHYLLRGEAAGLAPNTLFDPLYYRAQVSPYEDLPAGLLVHYLLHGWRRGLSPHPLFDGAWYFERYAESGAAGINPLLHFLGIGSQAGFSPHPLFNPRYYASRIGGAGDREVRALVAHFLTVGARAGLSPTALFDPEFYARRNPDAVAQGKNPLLHYVTRGDAEGRMPNIGFDPAWYRAQLGPEDAAHGCSLAHFVIWGQARGLSPSPLFDARCYLRGSPDVQRDRGNALEHYLEAGQHEPRDFHPLVDRGYLLAQTAAVRRGADCLRLLVDEPRCRAMSPTPLFDAEFYLSRYSEARAAKCGAFEHFLRVGAAAGYDPHPLFSTEFYGRQVDWRKRSRDPLSDYLRHGMEERSSPHPLLDGKLYLERYGDLAREQTNPLLHYLHHGGRGDERRIPHPLFDPAFFLEQLRRLPQRPHLLEFLSLSADELVDPHPLFDCRYYLDQAPELRAGCVNPLLDYVATPAGEAPNPHPLFDEQFYLAQRPELAGSTTPLLLHYLREGYKDYLSPHPCFDSRYVFDQAPDLVKDGRVPLLHYLLEFHKGFRGEESKYDPVPWFDGASYFVLHQHAGPEAVNPLLHFLNLNRGFEPPASVLRISPPAETGRAPKGTAQLAPDELFRSIVDLPVPVALAADSLSSFIGTQDFYVAGTVAKRRTAPHRIALYAVHSANGALGPSRREMLRALRHAGYATVVINSTRERGRAFLGEAKKHADVVVLRKGGGRDFASWMSTVALLWQQIGEAEQWLFVNDSLLGPLGDPAPIWRALAASTAEFWALTESFEQVHHLQSSFFVLRRPAFLSERFRRYLLRYEFPEDRIEIVRQGELGFSTAMMSSSLKAEVMVPYAALSQAWLDESRERRHWLDALVESTLSERSAQVIPPDARPDFVRFSERWLRRAEEAVRRGDPFNSQHHFWDTLLRRFSYPFVKRDLLATNPWCVPTVPRLRDIVGDSAWAMLSEILVDSIAPESPGGSVLRISPSSLRTWNERYREEIRRAPPRAKPEKRGGRIAETSTERAHA